MGNVIGSAIVYGFLIALCFYVLRNWRRWFRAEVKLKEPRWRTGVALFGFLSASTSLLIIIAVTIHAHITGGLPYYDPVLMLAFGLGFLTAICGVLAAFIGTGELEIPTIVCSLLCLLVWLAEAAAQ